MSRGFAERKHHEAEEYSTADSIINEGADSNTACLVIGFSNANTLENKQMVRTKPSLHAESQNNSNFKQTIHWHIQTYTTDILTGFLQVT
jgi:hypothetical protein